MTAVATSARDDARVTGLVGTAHFCSHFFQLALPPLFPIIKTEFGVSYAALGAVMTVFYTTSGICQAFAGILVDRFGARRMLIQGLALLAVGIGLMGFVTEFWMLFPLAALAGIGNSVFHPADFSILTTKVGASRLGRAYSVHAFSGTLGYALAPALIGSLAAFAGWRPALSIAGLAGLLAVVVFWRARILLVDPEAHVARGGRSTTFPGISYARLIAMPALLLAFGYFALTAASGIGVQTFSVPALVEIFDVGLPVATASLTGYLVCMAGGMLLGGILADRTARHHVVAMIGLFVSAVFLLVLWSVPVDYGTAVVLLFLSGLAVGVTGPSRDMLVRAATPRGATGKVFGFVYSGLDMGALIAPTLFGWLMDHAPPNDIFLAVAVLLVLAIGTVMQVRRQTVRAAA